MNLTHETSFAVFPGDCNYHYPMVFGGKMLAEMDRCAATAVRRFLYDSPTGAKHALTVGVDKMTFHKGAEVGDLIFLVGTIIRVGTKAITVKVVAERETNTFNKKPDQWIGRDAASGGYMKYLYRGKVTRESMAEGLFTFCAYDMEQKKSMPHGMIL